MCHEISGYCRDLRSSVPVSFQTWVIEKLHLLLCRFRLYTRVISFYDFEKLKYIKFIFSIVFFIKTSWTVGLASQWWYQSPEIFLSFEPLLFTTDTCLDIAFLYQLWWLFLAVNLTIYGMNCNQKWRAHMEENFLCLIWSWWPTYSLYLWARKTSAFDLDFEAGKHILTRGHTFS